MGRRISPRPRPQDVPASRHVGLEQTVLAGLVLVAGSALPALVFDRRRPAQRLGLGLGRRPRTDRPASCDGPSPAGHRGTGPASRRRGARAAGPRRPGRGRRSPSIGTRPASPGGGPACSRSGGVRSSRAAGRRRTRTKGAAPRATARSGSMRRTCCSDGLRQRGSSDSSTACRPGAASRLVAARGGGRQEAVVGLIVVRRRLPRNANAAHAAAPPVAVRSLGPAR